MQNQEDPKSPKTSTFFQTQSQKQGSLPPPVKEHQIHPYILNLHNQIDNALNSQGKAISRKKKKLYDELSLVKDEIYKKSEKSRKMEEYFRENCENILKKDITKWDDNKDFFIRLFEFYSKQLETIRESNKALQDEMQTKKSQLKTLMREGKTKYYQERINKIMMDKGMPLQYSKQLTINQTAMPKTYGKSTRVNTETSLPSLNKIQRNILFSTQINKIQTSQNQPIRLRTLGDERESNTNTERIKIQKRLPTYDNGVEKKPKNRYKQDDESSEKNYMRPLLKTQILLESMSKKQGSNQQSDKNKSFYKKSSNPYQLENLLTMLRWYKEDKYKKGNHNWFEKLLFVDRNFSKVDNYLEDALEEGRAKNKLYQLSTKEASLQSQTRVIQERVQKSERRGTENSSNLYRKIKSQKKLKY